jgi:hypothetical protein
MFFKNYIPIYKLLEKFVVFFLSPLPRYLYSGCCTRDDHAPNRLQEGIEDEMRKALMTCRGYYKDFFFTSWFRNVTVLNPGLETPQEDETGLQLWGPDPVHPLSEGYGRIIDMVCREKEKKDGVSRKREGETLEPRNNKRPRFEPARPSKHSYRLLCSQATATGGAQEETAAEAAVEAGGHGEARAEAGATTSPIEAIATRYSFFIFYYRKKKCKKNPRPCAVNKFINIKCEKRNKILNYIRIIIFSFKGTMPVLLFDVYSKGDCTCC